MKFNKELVSNRPLRWALRLLLWGPILWVAFPLLLEMIATVFPFIGQSLGRSAARRDAARSHYELRSNGLPADWWAKHMRDISGENRHAWSKNYRALLEKKYGIRERKPLGCLVFKFGRDYDSGYDQAQRAAIAGKFGPNAVLECAETVYADLNLKPASPSPAD